MRRPVRGPANRASTRSGGSRTVTARHAHALAIWALGLTQIVGYGTLYYSFAILAPAMAAEFRWPEQWVFGALSAALLAGGLLAPTAGRLADRFGAGRVMTVGSFAAALALLACGLAPERATFVLALVSMELASCFVLYSTAFVAIVQLGGRNAQRSITHLTLIAGFASTLFWPLTATLHQHLAWREVYVVFAGFNLLLCLPIHAWIAALSRRSGATEDTALPSALPPRPMLSDPRNRSRAFLLLLAGFAAEGFVLSAILVHMVPLTSALGLGAAGLFIASLFGPAQVASRLINMVFGGRLAQTWLAVIAAALPASGVLVLIATTPWLPGAVAFAILFGLGSGLTSIVGGTLPLELFGRERYGARLGWIAAARQLTSALAPFALALMMASTTISTSLWVLVTTGAAGLVAFFMIAMVQRHALQMRHDPECIGEAELGTT
ncbi:MAG: arsenite efflux MFS transporter ArsK [Rhizobiaceae bacterium]|nr:arsenite efflux MFS transporter ArsK [Rhizobiaceae bacterium]MCV0405718.1 arsenite efflux MFS transporter ArsK [Rhizobiaceae bacterium]